MLRRAWRALFQGRATGCVFRPDLGPFWAGPYHRDLRVSPCPPTPGVGCVGITTAFRPPAWWPDFR